MPDTAWLPWFCGGLGVGSGLGPGLTLESADAWRVVLGIDLSSGAQAFWHPPALPV